MEKANLRVNGIFDELNIPDSYASIRESYARGRIKGDVRVTTKDVASTAMLTHSKKPHNGLEVTLVNDRGEGVVFIPQKEIPVVSELAAMNGSLVEYKSRTWSSGTEGTSVDSELKFLEGKLTGNTYKGNEFA